MKDHSPSQLLLDWANAIEAVGNQIDTAKSKKMKTTMYLLVRALRMGLIAFYSPIACGYWKTKKIKLKKGDEWQFEADILDEDFDQYQSQISRMLSLQVMGIIEGHFRNSKNTGVGIAKILEDKFTTIPPAIDVIRLLKNGFHNRGIHNWKNSIKHTIAGYDFEFVKGKATKHFHLFALLKVVEQVALEIANKKSAKALP